MMCFLSQEEKKAFISASCSFLGKEPPNDCSDTFSELQTQQPIFPFGSITLLDGDSVFLPF